MSYRLLSNVLGIIEREQLLSGTFPACRKMLDFQHPEELERRLPLKIGSENLSENALTEILSEVAKYSLKTTHPGFYNQQYGGVDPYSLCATILSEALNTNAHTFEVAPVFMVIEKSFIDYLWKLFGWQSGDGIFCAGGSMSCMYAMILARNKMCPDLKKTGFFGSRPLAAFASEECHYWIRKAGTFMGYGSDNIYLVKTDQYGKMIPEDLELSIAKAKVDGKIPNFVCGTAGTTVTGAFDDLTALFEICQKHGMWLHVDAAWGGAAIMSEKYRGVLKGVEKADSLSWNPHKMLCMSLQTSVFLTRHPTMLRDTLSLDAGYIFQPDKFYDKSYDLGEKSLQCGRKVDAFKMWFAFKAHGEEHLSREVTRTFDLSRYFFDLIKNRDGFEMVLDRVQCTNVCFWYIPPCLRGLPKDQEFWQRLGKVAPMLKERMVKEGSLMIGYQKLDHKNLVNFLRLVVTISPKRSEADMEFVVDEIERLGKDVIA